MIDMDSGDDKEMEWWEDVKVGDGTASWMMWKSGDGTASWMMWKSGDDTATGMAWRSGDGTEDIWDFVKVGGHLGWCECRVMAQPQKTSGVLWRSGDGVEEIWWEWRTWKPIGKKEEI